MTNTSILWFRRDLRLADNHALCTALATSEHIVPTYVLDPVLLERYAGTKRLAFLLAGLRQLDQDLRAKDSRLVVREGHATAVLTRLTRETGARAIYAEADYTPYALTRDADVSTALPLHLIGGPTIHPPDAVLKSDRDPYVVFTPYRRRWRALPPPRASALLAAPQQIPTPPGIEGLDLPTEPRLPDAVPFAAGEAEALRRLDHFAPQGDAGIYAYAQQRDRVDLDGTSQISPYLRFGMLSARQTCVTAYQAIKAAPDDMAREGADTWLNELVWREFYTAILYHFPHVLQDSFRSNLRSIEWENDETAFQAWCRGETGYPIVDAAMRQLVSTGWMHNRARMIVASFLVKDMLIDWRWGEGFFMQHLVDGDPAANNGGWQWTAGTGTDAAPYFRIFNPTLQGEKHDPEGTYVRRWLPELANVPTKYIHTPSKMDRETQQAAGCVLGRHYPTPILDHRHARERTLAAYRAARARAESNE
jgi:deoxyribodipyrimidine photo-lyase